VSIKPKKEIDCLNPVEVAILLKWLRKNEPGLYPMGVLASLAGLRMLEAAALRRQDIDFERSTVEITDTGEHVPKTASSYRVIPVCSEVLDALRVHLDGLKVIPATGELFRNRIGRVWGPDGLSRKWGKALAKASEKTKVERFGEIPTHRLRSSFATMARELGADRDTLKRYLGQSPGDILGDHYLKIDLDGMRSVSGLMESWRGLLRASKNGKKLATLQKRKA
jgi:integrase